ncbi:aminotransferase-like domain-containing protein [Chitinophaga nivalis]|uniref:PLP-dependent aminotransferase family protein n=1 Tax=Chitinophaga nivalis TaxID=2991709 RepID=A0ABT3IJ50_9BACT|nr:PLP-dependent aminotransferase family protein [Chitinophaga nivalis]MCW3466358.1 PLP-dependent aminotransferase family protein [Chitinophaga nivalis]MCW3483951.1 PLP-dependent aminotransferase family protein [Chitinophaga nivalis]
MSYNAAINIGQDFNAINPLLKELGEDVMGFLNEIQLRYPAAVSFASGRPNEQYFGLEEFADHFNRFVEEEVVAGKKERQAVIGGLGQYNRAKGVINAAVAKYLEQDEQIKANPEDILITVGTQEAVALVALTLCDREQDVIIVEDPTYVGITHFSIIAGYQLAPVQVGENGIDLDGVEKTIIRYREQGRKVKLVYVIPDYQNPTGNSMPGENRRRLLQLADQYDFYILEDNAYGEFNYDGVELLPIKAIDINKRVIYLRSFAKTLYPALRLAAIVADQQIELDGKATALSDLLAKTKGYTTVNTSTINQAVFAGLLIRENYSLKAVNREKVADLKQKRTQLLAALSEYLHPDLFPADQAITWNIPGGGFFITIHTPFHITKEDVIHCAEKYQVIFTPMSFFYLGEGGDKELRLAFSNVSAEQIKTGISRLAAFLQFKLQAAH